MGVLSRLLGAVSGNNNLKVSEQLLFDKVIGFRGIVPGCGTSTIVQNVAVALSEKTNFTVCVLDTNFLYPVQYPLLVSTESKEKNKDFLDYSGDLSDITIQTQFNNVYLVHLNERTIVDMLSGKDTEVVINKLIQNLKSFFDVVLIDISTEFTNIAIHSSIKCNRIYQVGDSSMKSLYHVKKSINTMSTLATPLAKANKIILNKQIPDVVLGVKTAMEEAGLYVIGEIPLSVEIAANGATGKKIYGAISKNREVSLFNRVIDEVIEDIAEKTPLNAKYFNVSKVLDDMEKEKRFMEKHGDEVIDTVDDFVYIMDSEDNEEETKEALQKGGEN